MSSKAHAQHNKAVSDHLLAQTSFNDWVVTTAFYAALHYVQGKIFPYTEGSQTFQDIDSYVSHLNRASSGRTHTKHSAVKALVGKQLPHIRNEYRKLFDTCMTARYFMYKVQKSAALDAQAVLLLIEQACT